MYLSDRDLEWAIRKGRLIVKGRSGNDPPPTIDPTSIDLHLDNVREAKIWNISKYLKDCKKRGIGGLFQKAFHYYCAFRDEFLTHYHKRSNVESTFSMMKAKFGDSLRSKSDTAMVNEALCKILCHNICCLIQSIFELEIEAKFWGQGETERTAEDSRQTQDDDPLAALAWV